MWHLPGEYRQYHPSLGHASIIGASLRQQTDGSRGYVLNVLIDGNQTDLLLPRTVYIPYIGETSVVSEAAELPVAQSFTATERPVRPGASLSPVGHMAGTVCAIVHRPGWSRPCRSLSLSCEHVLFPDFSPNKPQPILQPASSDGAQYPNGVIGHQFARGGLFANGINDVDAAIVRLKNDIGVSNQPVSEVFTISSLPIRPVQGSKCYFVRSAPVVACEEKLLTHQLIPVLVTTPGTVARRYNSDDWLDVYTRINQKAAIVVRPWFCRVQTDCWVCILVARILLGSFVALNLYSIAYKWGCTNHG